MSRFLAALLALATLVTTARAGVLVVAADGSGHFTDLPTAIAAASDGDVLLVRSGSYSAFTITNKSLDVVADTGTVAVVHGSSLVRQLDAARCVTLTGLALRGPPSDGSRPPALVLEDNAGAIRIQGCDVVGGSGPLCLGGSIHGASALRALQCADVAIARSRLEAGRGSNGYAYAGAGDDGVYGLASRLALYDCELVGGAGGGEAACGPSGYGYAGFGGAGTRSANALEFFASRCTFRGGDSGLSTYAGLPGPALAILGGAPAALLDIALAPGVDPSSTHPSIALHVFGTTVTSLAGSGKSLTMNRVVREGANARVELAGQPGDVVELTFADAAAFATSPAWRGVDLLRRAKPRAVMHAGTIGASGSLHLTWPILDLGAGVEGRRVFLQASFRDAGGVTTLSTPATVVLLDAAI